MERTIVKGVVRIRVANLRIIYDMVYNLILYIILTLFNIENLRDITILEKYQFRYCIISLKLLPYLPKILLEYLHFLYLRVMIGLGYY